MNTKPSIDLLKSLKATIELISDADDGATVAADNDLIRAGSFFPNLLN